MTWKPEGLSERGSAFWDDVTSRWALRPDELQILADAAFEIGIVEKLQAEFERRDLITTGSMGQDVAAPHVSEIRQHRATLSALLTKLRLPDDANGEGSGSSSNAGRALVNQRWHPRSAG